MKKNIFDYLADLFYGGTKYPCGWFKPKVVKGHFNKSKNKELQEYFFNSLLSIGFKRTYWQLIFPNQNAGLIKKIPITGDGINEYHIRFYNDGTIDCELEVGRFSMQHWSGPRKDGTELLNKILSEMNHLQNNSKDEISNLFATKEYSKNCIRNK